MKEFYPLQEILVDRAVHAAVSRFLPSNASLKGHEGPALLMEDFSQAMHDFLPVAMRDITKLLLMVGALDGMMWEVLVTFKTLLRR